MTRAACGGVECALHAVGVTCPTAEAFEEMAFFAEPPPWTIRATVKGAWLTNKTRGASRGLQRPSP